MRPGPSGISRQEVWEQPPIGEYDLQCPQIDGGKPNYWRSQCVRRQHLNLQCRSCPTGRQVMLEDTGLVLPFIVATKPRAARQRLQQWCECGNVSLSQWAIREYRLGTRNCKACKDEVVQQRKAARAEAAAQRAVIKQQKAEARAEKARLKLEAEVEQARLKLEKAMAKLGR